MLSSRKSMNWRFASGPGIAIGGSAPGCSRRLFLVASLEGFLASLEPNRDFPFGFMCILRRGVRCHFLNGQPFGKPIPACDVGSSGPPNGPLSVFRSRMPYVPVSLLRQTSLPGASPGLKVRPGKAQALHACVTSNGASRPVGSPANSATLTAR